MTPEPADADAPATARCLKCDHCDRSFTRPSHLNRHRLTHLPPSRRNVIPCPRCGRLFSRHDVLLRHLRASHDVDVGSKTTYQKSCHRCVQKKLRCDRELPCRSCTVASADAACEYPANDDPVDEFKTSPGLSEPGRDGIDEAPAHGDGGTAQTTPQSLTDSASSSFRQPEPPRYTVVPATVATPDLRDPVGPPLYEADGFDPGFPGIAKAEPMAGGFAFAPSLATAGQLDFRGSGFDWLNFDVPDMNHSIHYDWGAGGLATNRLLSNPLGPTLPGDEPLPPVEPRPAILPWPFEQGHEPATSRCPLPSLREVLQQAVQQHPGRENAALEGMARLLSEHRLPPRGELLDANASAGLTLLKRLLGHFFSGFQIIQPMIHVPTWNVMECPTTMLAAMACIGAVLSDLPNAAELASSISDFCARMINWQGFSDSANYSNILYLATLCLHQIYSLGSGNRQLYQNADRTRGVLIGSLRGLDLLTSRLRLLNDAEEAPRPTSSIASVLHSEWMSWIEDERNRRIAWASFEYDCSLCTLTGRRGAVDLSELPSALPCIDALWEAPSAQAWAAMRAQLTPNALGAPLSSVLQAVVADKSAPDHVSVWGKRLAAQVIGRLLWDIRQLEIISAREYFGLPSLFKAHQQSKEPLLLGLDCLLASMNDAVTTPDLVSYNISGLLCHYSHLYAAGDIMDMVLYIVRNIVSQGSRRDGGISLARHRLTNALAADAKRSRRLLWHAGQVVAIAKEYLVSAPCEIMRLFMGYVFIIAFARYCPRWPQAGGGPVQLDLARNIGRQDEEDRVANWIEHGGNARFGPVEDIFADSATALVAKDAQAVLLRLQGWGLSEKFVKIVQHFEANDM